MLGAGVALLLGERLPAKEKKAVGWTLLLIGVLTTIPLAAQALSRSRRVEGGNGK
jgi:4-amino-4-deoxy-L-arabinose transferase-like glycosyltransferase